MLDTDDVLEEGVVVLDSHMRLRFANPAAVTMLSSSVDSLLVQEWDRVLANNEALREPIEEVVQKGLLVRERDVEVNIRERWVELRLNGYPIASDAGGIAAAVLLLRDAVRARTLERDLVYASRFKAITDLYMGITHDIKVPLHAVIMHLEMLRKEVGGDSRGGEDKKAVRYIDSIAQESTSGNHHSCFRTMPHPSKSVSWSTCVDHQRLHGTARIEAARRILTLRQESCGEPLWVHGDDASLKQALLNLAVNAFDAWRAWNADNTRYTYNDECLQTSKTQAGYQGTTKGQDFSLSFTPPRTR